VSIHHSGSSRQKIKIQYEENKHSNEERKVEARSNHQSDEEEKKEERKQPFTSSGDLSKQMALEDLIKFMKDQDKRKVEHMPRQGLSSLINDRNRANKTTKKPITMKASPPRKQESETPARGRRRVSSSELVERNLDYDLDLNKLDCAEQLHPREPLFGEFKFMEDFKMTTLKALAKKNH